MFLIPGDYWEVKNTKEKGRGIFAKKDLSPGVVIGDYIGKVLRTKDENTIEEDIGLYLMYYHDNASIYPDIDNNGVHLLNHSCTPNCWMYTYKGHTLFFTLRQIFKEEELTISYLLSPKDKYCNPCNHECKCGSAFCSGTMHLSKAEYERWAEFQNIEEKKTKRERLRYGKTLPMLTSYPYNIPDNKIYKLFGSPFKLPEKLNNNQLPDIKEIRRLIRERGKYLYFPLLNLKIFGVVEDKIIS